jgi:16S rRNA (cytosine967-C5)-methyltransferase
MTPSARLAASIDLLAAMEAAPRKPADAVANSFFRERRYIGGGDRRAISGLVWDVMRGWRRLGWWLQKQNLPVSARLLCGARLVLDGMAVSAVANLYAEGRYATGVLERHEWDGFIAMQDKSLDSPDMPRAVRLELPDWLLPRLEETFGPALETEIKALSGEAPLDLRVNTLLADRAEARKALGREGLHAEPTPHSPWGLRLEGRLPVTASAPFRDGRVEIQDEGSQLVAAMTAAGPEMRVLDYCAGAGGKTLAMAMMMNNRGHIVACDVSEPRLDGAVRRLRRAGVHNVERHLLGVTGDKWAKRRARSFDRVLVDAPCSGTGTWRRNPDARFRTTETDLAELLVKQAAIMDRAAALVRPGGRMIYATCSLLKAENADQIHAFLARHPDFRLVPSEAPDLPESLRHESMISLTPARDETDGFFGAVMERIPAQDEASTSQA